MNGGPLTSMTAEHRVWLSLGSNIRPRVNLRAALRLLGQVCSIERCSPVFRTAPQGDPHQADFLNMALRIRTTLSADDFQRKVIQKTEGRLKRQRDPHNRNAARTIDIDVALWGDAVFQYGEPARQIPDPDILRYAHVALPLAAIAPALRHPVTGQTLGEIAEALGSNGILQLPLDLCAADDELSPRGPLRVQ